MNRSFQKSPIYIAVALGLSAAGSVHTPLVFGESVEEVIVTGVAGGRGMSKFDTSYAISTMSAEDIAKQAPSGFAELMMQTPGLFVESSGGALGNNVYTRGLPADNFRYIRALEDGLPTFEEGAGAFSNADIYSRVDETVERVEIVRGGSAAITASNAPGSTINTITRKGTEDQQGKIKFTTSDYGLYRADFNVSGPLSDKVLYHVGGYQASEEGIRDPGFTANKGGQVKAGLTYVMEDGEVYVGVKSINDSNTFYTPMPMASDDKSLPGLDARDGSLVSADFGSIITYDGAGSKNKSINIMDGVETKVDSLTVLFDKDLGNGWAINNKFRRITGNLNFAAVFSGGNRFDDLDDELEDLQDADASTVGTRFRYTHGDGTLLDVDQLPNGRVIDQGLWETKVELDNFINDFQFAKSMEFGGGGTNDIVVGFYYSQFDQTQEWNWAQVITEVKDQPMLLDLVGVDAMGEETVAFTDRGIWNHHANLQEFHDDVTHTAVYATDTWQINEALRVDIGVRWHQVDKAGTIAQTEAVDLGDPTTLADDSVAVFTGGITPYEYEDEEVAYTVGANYQISDSLAVFARYSEAFRFTPEFAQWFNCCNPTESDIELYEGGVKYDAENLSVYLTLFGNKFPNVAFSTQVQDDEGNVIQEDAFASTEAVGLEWEISYTPMQNLELNFSGFYQSIEYKGFDFIQDGVAVDFTGNQVVRQPETVMTFRPSYYFGDNQNSVYLTLMHTGKRYSDAANTVELPEYTTLDAGVIFNVSDNLSFQISGSNLTDEIGITEGNPRTGVVTAGTSDVFVGRAIFGRSFKLSATLDF